MQPFAHKKIKFENFSFDYLIYSVKSYRILTNYNDRYFFVVVKKKIE